MLNKIGDGVSEEDLTNYVVGVSKGKGNSQLLYEKIIKEGYAQAAVKIDKGAEGLRVDIQDAREGMIKVIKKIWKGYSQRDLVKFVGLAGNPQELYNEVVRNGFIDAVEKIKQANPKVEIYKKYALEGMAKILKKIGWGYSEDDLANFVGLAGNPQELFDQVVQQGYVEATIQIQKQNPNLEIKDTPAYQGLGVLSTKVGHGYSTQDAENFLQALGLDMLLKPNL